MTKTIIERLEEMRDELADIYSEEVKDDLPDNGNLTNLNSLILDLNALISTLKAAGRG